MGDTSQILTKFAKKKSGNFNVKQKSEKVDIRKRMTCPAWN